jgi:UV DNA damage repair endonuclease
MYELTKKLILDTYEKIYIIIEYNNISVNSTYKISGDLFYCFYKLYIKNSDNTIICKIIEECLKNIGSTIKTYNQNILIYDKTLILNDSNMITLLNTKNKLKYYVEILNKMKLDGSYILINNFPINGSKRDTINLWRSVFLSLPYNIQKLIIIENTSKQISIQDCIDMNIFTDVVFIFNKPNFLIYKKRFTNEKFNLCNFYKRKTISVCSKKNIMPIFIYNIGSVTNIKEKDVKIILE